MRRFLGWVLAAATLSACGEDAAPAPVPTSDAASAGDTAVEATPPDTGSGGSRVTLPDVSSATFVKAITNPYLPLPVGGRWVYEAVTSEGVERDVVEVRAETKTIQGVEATVVYDVVTLDGTIIEETHDWYAQDATGAVWYLGEDTCEFEEGQCVKHAGAWEWGVDGALPGILMPAAPAVDGKPYYQEYYPGEAEDVGEVVAVGEEVTVPAGSWTDCIKTHETSTLDLSLDENKLYCRGVGPARILEPDAIVQLIELTGPGLGPTHAEVGAWVADYKAAHPGKAGDILALSAAELAADPDAARLRALCGADRLPVVPLLAWEYGGADHAWVDPEASALVYCVYIPAAPSTAHWTYDAAKDRVTADMTVLFPGQNPCGSRTGAETVSGCIGAPSNYEILVDTASYHDGKDVGLSLSEASTELNLLLADGSRVHLTTAQ